MPVPYWLCKVPLQRSAWQCHLNKYILITIIIKIRQTFPMSSRRCRMYFFGLWMCSGYRSVVSPISHATRWGDWRKLVTRGLIVEQNYKTKESVSRVHYFYGTIRHTICRRTWHVRVISRSAARLIGSTQTAVATRRAAWLHARMFVRGSHNNRSAPTYCTSIRYKLERGLG